MTSQTHDCIRVRGARQNNLRALDLDIPLRQLVVVTGVSGSGKSSLVFDTVYAEGQRRYVETFSPYARQFLDRMDKPQVDRIEGIPPAIAIDQTNPVRTSRSTVGTMTELNDHLKLLYARAARLHCRGCGRPVRRDTPDSIAGELRERAAASGDPRLVLTFPVEVPKNFTEEEVLALLAQQGYTRVHARAPGLLEIVQDRLRAAAVDRSRLLEAVEAALRVGRGRVNVHVEQPSPQPSPARAGEGVWRFSADLHCADCDIHYRDPTPSLFSFNSPLGACDTCRGFGRVIGVDYGLVVPDTAKTLRGGAIRPWQTESYRECQDDLEKFARKRGIPLDVPWRELTAEQRRWVIDGEGPWEKKVWYGAKRFFAWLETKSYKMHIRVLLSKYRSYTACADCGGARLKPEALLWRLGAPGDGQPGLNIHDLMLLPVERVSGFFAALALPAPLDEAADLLLGEIRARLDFLVRVGLGYLTLDRQSRTLSGGEVQRINLTTALGTSLTNTLFVLDEPSIGLHPRDMRRVIEVMQRLRDNGNSLLVVEHDPQIMLAADRIVDLGPGPGEHGGRIVFNGTPAELAGGADTLTAAYLSGRKDAAQAAGHRGPPRPGDPRLVVRGATRAQPAGPRRGDPARPPRVRDRRVGLRQVHAGAGRAARRAVARQGQAHRGAGPASRAARRGTRRRGGAGGPDRDRSHHALEPGELRRRVRRDPQALRGRGGVDRARLHARHLQLQFRQRPLSDLRRQRLRARRDAVPLRRVPALPGLRRAALSAGDPRGKAGARRRAGAQHRRRPRHDGVGGSGVLRRRSRAAGPHRAAGRRRTRVPAPRPARADAVGRRGAAAQARQAPGGEEGTVS